MAKREEEAKTKPKAKGKAEKENLKKKSKSKKGKKKDKKKNKKKAKTKQLTVKKTTKSTSSAAPEVIPSVPSNFLKNEKGRTLIRNMMSRLHDLDDAAFPKNPSFTPEGVCRVKAAECEGVKWPDFLARSPDFFVAESSG